MVSFVHKGKVNNLISAPQIYLCRWRKKTLPCLLFQRFSKCFFFRCNGKSKQNTSGFNPQNIGKGNVYFKYVSCCFFCSFPVHQSQQTSVVSCGVHSLPSWQLKPIYSFFLSRFFPQKVLLTATWMECVFEKKRKKHILVVWHN